MNVSSTRWPKTTYIESSNLNECLKKEKIVEVEVATTIQKKKNQHHQHNRSKYYTDKNKKKGRIMKSSTKTNNDV